VQIDKAYDNRVLVHHERFPTAYPMKKDFNLKEELKEVDFIPYHYEVVGGDGVFNVSVGPIHAGIIEPGHFHFSQAGEQILHLEVRHFYKYRGIEKLCEGKTLKNIQKIVSRISGNESIAYQSALQNIVGMSKNHKLQNAILLELERLVHHFTDIGFIPNDGGFAAALTMGSKYAEETKRLLNLLSSSRFGFDAVFKSLHVEEKKQKIDEFVTSMSKEIEWFEDWIIDIPSLWDRMDTTGIITEEEVLNYGCVGVVARCCGINEDVRSKDEFYKKYGFEMASEQSGDVAARFKVRISEIKNSLVMIKNMLNDLESFELENNFTCKDGEYSSLVESSIGELYMYVKVKDGLVERFYVRDPSFINWQALHLMMPRDIIADFPLINKSCDLSYAGSDL
jgi:Ni,Fe-hydrogenase III large subunit